MPGIPLEWRENCTYTGLAQWKEHLTTNQGLLGVRISHPVPSNFRTPAGSKFLYLYAYFPTYKQR